MCSYHQYVAGLIEERALLLGRMGLHEKALDLYTHTLKNAAQAEEFCRKVYEQNPTENSEVGYVIAVGEILICFTADACHL